MLPAPRLPGRLRAGQDQGHAWHRPLLGLGGGEPCFQGSHLDRGPFGQFVPSCAGASGSHTWSHPPTQITAALEYTLYIKCFHFNTIPLSQRQSQQARAASEHQEFLGTLLGEGGGGRGRAEALLGFKDIRAHLLPVTLLHFVATCLHLKVDPVAGSLVYNRIDKIVLGIPPVCDFLPPPPGQPRVRSQLLPILCPRPQPCAGHVAGALRVGTPFLPSLFFGRPTCLFHGRRSWLLQEALCGECGRHLRKS